MEKIIFLWYQSMKRGEINDCSLQKTAEKRENEGENVERRERKTERNERQYT